MLRTGRQLAVFFKEEKDRYKLMMRVDLLSGTPTVLTYQRNERTK